MFLVQNEHLVNALIKERLEKGLIHPKNDVCEDAFFLTSAANVQTV